MRERTGPESRRTLHDALIAEIEDLTARIRELTALIEGGRRAEPEETREDAQDVAAGGPSSCTLVSSRASHRRPQSGQYGPAA